ncbi:MAG: hypothetical protein EOO61_05245 [Hymenobacter sp.]|nr:MAG: hypothetical protein EOO61_05245 [Hymenobacter sp.]
MKEEATLILSFLILTFLFAYLGRNIVFQKISFSIALAFLAYCTWSVIITFCLTEFLYNNFISEGNGYYDIFAFSAPVILALWTLIWSYRKRIGKPKYEVRYIICLFITLFILAIRKY